MSFKKVSTATIIILSLAACSNNQPNDIPSITSSSNGIQKNNGDSTGNPATIAILPATIAILPATIAILPATIAILPATIAILPATLHHALTFRFHTAG